MMQVDLWVDFNDSDGHGNVVTLKKYAKHPVRVGDRVLVGDDDGDTCEGTVVEMDSKFIAIHLIGETFSRDGEMANVATA